MGFRFRKSIKVAPGVRLNVGKRGFSTTIGGKGLRVNTSSRGVSVGTSIPGTGVSYNKQITSRNKRPQRTNYERIIQQQTRTEAIEKAKQEVDRYEAHVDMLTSVHEEVTKPISWQEIETSPPPFEKDQGPNVRQALEELENYIPTWRDKLFNRTEVRKQLLMKQVDEAKILDEQLLNDWKEQVELAKGVLNKDKKIWNKVLTKINPFEDIEQLGSAIKWELSPEESLIKVNLDIKNKHVVPTKVLSLTKTGKLSQKNMPKGQYFQLYQDYVCSCTLRIAREFFNILPINKVLINVYDEVSMNEVSEYGCVLSVIFPRYEFEQLTFNNIDCSDTIELFRHNMKFLKTKGFKFVEELNV